MSTESPISVTFSLLDPNDFPILLTFRSDDPKILMSELIDKSSWLKANGYKAQVKKSFGWGDKKPIEYVDGEVCPLCKEKLVKATTKDGKTFIKCSTQKYDFATKSITGCKYVKWPD